MCRPLVLALLLLTACAGRDDPVAVTTTSTSSTTTAPAPTTSTVPPQTPLPSGAEAVDALLGAWQAGDRVGALLVAVPAAVDALFAIVPEPGDARGCNSGNVNVNITCVFRLSVGELQVRAAPTADGAGFLVDFVILGELSSDHVTARR